MAEKLTGALQENLITLLAHDDKNGKLIAQIADVELFEGDYRLIAERAIDYWTKHKQAPKSHMRDLVSDVVDDPKNRKAKTFERIIRSMVQLYEEVNTEYVIGELRKFTRMQRMKDAVLRSAEMLHSKQEQSIDEVESILGDLLRAREVGFEPALKLTDISRIVDYFETHQHEFMLGIPEFDHVGIVPFRGATMLFLAPTGRGKTWFLIHAGKHAILQRKKVLHVSLEMSEEQVAMRYMQQLYSIPKRKQEIEISRIIMKQRRKANELEFDTVKIKKFKPKYALNSETIAKRLRAEVRPWTAKLNNLRIKRFPPRALSMNGLRAYLDALEAIEGFIPDMLVLDYIGITKTDAANQRITLGRAFEDFRAICVERNVAGVTAHQTSKISADAVTVKSTHVAEDWSLIATSDVAVTYSQTLAEKRYGLARLFVDKARDDEDKFGVLITQQYKIGQFVLQTAPLDQNYWDYLDDIRSVPGDDDDDDD